MAANVGGDFDLEIDGQGYMLATLDQEAPFEFRSYEVQAIPITKPRIDDSREPGEQSLGHWWTRAQHSWHLGIGQEILDAEESSRFKVTDMFGLDPWEEGILETSTSFGVTKLGPADLDPGVKIIGTDAGLIAIEEDTVNQAHKWADPTATIENLATPETTGANYLTTDGNLVYVAFAGTGKIYSLDPEAFTSFTLVNDHADVDVIGFVKGRLIGAKDNELFEYDLSTTDIPESFHKDLSSAWKFTAITESGPALYFSGFAGNRSEIFAARLTAQDIPFASVATVGALRSVWQAPLGETVYHVKGNVGQQVLIATSKGVRIGNIITGEGDLDVGPLIVETDKPCLWIEPWENWAYFGWGHHVSPGTVGGTEVGIGRLHLGDLSYTMDLFSGLNTGIAANLGNVLQIAVWNNYDAEPVPVMAAERVDNSTIHVVAPSWDNTANAPNRRGYGFFTIQEIWFGTTEKKRLRFFDVVVDATLGPTDVKTGWDLEMGADGAAESLLIDDHRSDGYSENSVTLQASKYSMTFTIRATDSNASQERAFLRQWRLRATPRATKRFRYLVPMMLYDYLTVKTGQTTGKPGLAWELLDKLETIYRGDNEVTFKTPESAAPSGRSAVTVTMEDLRFKAFAPPRGAEGFGGIALAVLEEVR